MPDGFSVRYTITNDRFPELSKQIPAKAGLIVRKTLIDIYAHAMATCPVRTGFLKASHEWEMLSQTSGRVYNTASYARDVHEGTYRMAPRPWLRQSAELAKQSFDAAVEASLRTMG